jgi:class 3 adenylate cyclase
MKTTQSAPFGPNWSSSRRYPHSKTLAQLQTRVGIATGMVVAGDLIEADEARERGIVGDATRRTPSPRGP